MVVLAVLPMGSSSREGTETVGCGAGSLVILGDFRFLFLSFDARGTLLLTDSDVKDLLLSVLFEDANDLVEEEEAEMGLVD